MSIHSFCQRTLNAVNLNDIRSSTVYNLGRNLTSRLSGADEWTYMKNRFTYWDKPRNNRLALANRLNDFHTQKGDWLCRCCWWIFATCSLFYSFHGRDQSKKQEIHTHTKQSWSTKVIICGCLVYLLVHTIPDRVVTIEVKEEIDTLIEQLGRMTWTRTGLTILTKIRRI